jgi:hypothetical protein
MGHTMNRPLLGLLGLALWLQSCTSFFERGFRTEGTYAFNKSGFQIQIISQGIRETDQDFVMRKLSRIQICPLRPNQGRPVRLSLASEMSQTSMTLDGSPIQTQTDPTSTFYQALRSAGYKTPDPIEMKAVSGIISRGIYVQPLDPTQVVTVTRDANGNSVFEKQPPDPILLKEWQNRPTTITVLNQTEDYDYRFNRSSPPDTWVNPEALTACP